MKNWVKTHQQGNHLNSLLVLLPVIHNISPAGPVYEENRYETS